METSRLLRFNKLDVLVLGVIVLIGLIHLPCPFGGDQALFTIGALKISNGAVLYRDFWDLKQPAFYGFYVLAGSLFGFDEIGIHTFELLYMALFSLVLMKTLKGYYTNPSMVGLVPLLTVGTYYGVSEPWHLTQVEVLVGFPMFLSLWFASEPSSSARFQTRFFLSGVMGGIVLLFKLMFLPMIAAFWFTTLINATLSKREAFLSTLIRIGVPVVLGMAVPLLIVVGYFASNNTVGLLYWTTFEYPAQLMRDPPYTNPVINGLRWFISQCAPLIALGCIGAYVSLSNRRDRLLTVNLVLWLILGLAVILLQRFSRWDYHYLLLLVPLGIFSVKALDIFWEKLKAMGLPVNSWSGHMAGILGLVLLFSPVLNSLAKRGFALARSGFALTREQRLQYQSIFNYTFNIYIEALEEVRFLSEPGSLPGDIYIGGEQIYYFLSGRNQAIALNGWGLELWLPSQSTRLTRELAEARPPYIFLMTGYVNLISEKSPGTARFIDENYLILRTSNRGVWYVLKENQKHNPANTGASSGVRTAFEG
jgi:hypothetical protein